MTQAKSESNSPALRRRDQPERRSARVAPIKERRQGQRRSLAGADEAYDEFSSVAFAVAMRVTGSRQASSEITQELLNAVLYRSEERDSVGGPQLLRTTDDGSEAANPPNGGIELGGWLPMDQTLPVVSTAGPRHPTVTVVIPTLNEAKNLPAVLERLPHWIEEVIIVDGHSTDDTVSVAKALRPDVKVVLQTGKGKGNALSCGFKASTSEITVMLDADGSTDPAEIPRFVAALTNGFDFAKGTRFVTGGGSDDITRVRRLGNWGITTLVNRIWGSKYSDLAYGYNAFWTAALPPSFSDCDGFEVETLMSIRLADSDIKVVEVPSFEANRVHGTSNLHARRDGFRVLRTILSEWMRPR